MDSDSSAYFAVKYDDEERIPREICLTSSKSIPEEAESVSIMEDAGLQVDASDDLVTLQRNYFAQMHDYIDGLPLLVKFAPLLQINTLRHFVEERIEIDALSKVKIGKWTYFEIKKEHKTEISREYNSVVRSGRAMSSLPEMVHLGFVSQFDAFLGRLLRLCYEFRPDLISNSQKSFPAHEVLKFSDIEAFKEAVVEKEIETFLRKSHSDQFEWLEKSFGLPLRKDLKSWPDFIETFERRNLFAHSRGVVSEQYRLKCFSVSCKNVPSKGERLSVSPSYIVKRLQIFTEIGLKLAQVLSRKLDPSEENIVNNDSVLNDIGYQLIEHGHYGLAAELLAFGENCPKHPDDSLQKMMIVNRANALKLSGKSTEAAELLNSVKWQASSVEFRISVAAVLGETDSVLELMPRFAPEGMDPSEALRRWPVFVHVREREDFLQRYTELFKVDYVRAFDVKKVVHSVDETE